MRKRTFIIADIHGAYDALLKVFYLSGFDREQDRLICLGDVCDRRDGVKACVDELLKVKHLILILGNHDYWALQWMQKVRKNEPPDKVQAWLEGEQGRNWIMQGGNDTINSYQGKVDDTHFRFFSGAKYYHLEENKLFVHGGIIPEIPLNEQDPETFLWDRSLVEAAVTASDTTTGLTQYDAIYVGHTPTLRLRLSGRYNVSKINQKPGKSVPRALCTPHPSDMHSISNEDYRKTDKSEDLTSQGGRWNDFPARQCNVYLMDTGAGWSGGRLSLMNLDTCEVWQSDVLP